MSSNKNLSKNNRQVLGATPVHPCWPPVAGGPAPRSQQCYQHLLLKNF